MNEVKKDEIKIEGHVHELPLAELGVTYEPVDGRVLHDFVFGKYHWQSLTAHNNHALGCEVYEARKIIEILEGQLADMTNAFNDAREVAEASKQKCAELTEELAIARNGNSS